MTGTIELGTNLAYFGSQVLVIVYDLLGSKGTTGR